MVKDTINRMHPKVHKNFLLIMSGAMWLGVGIMLNVLATHWLMNYGRPTAWIFGATGFIAGIINFRFGFSKVANKNINRIAGLKENPGVGILNFMSLKSYMLVVVMIALGITLRHSSLPKQHLAMIYLTIGLGLFLSSFRYFVLVWNNLTKMHQDLSD